MTKKIRQYIGLLFALMTYYAVHEGAHFFYAIYLDVFKQINIIGLGIQVDVYREYMTDLQLGLFCVLGSLMTLFVSYVLVIFSTKVEMISSKVIKASLYYMTITLLFIDPLYLSVIYTFVGGGDMNGISLLIPEIYVRLCSGIIFVVNLIIFIKIVLPRYQNAFKGIESEKN